MRKNNFVKCSFVALISVLLTACASKSTNDENTVQTEIRQSANSQTGRYYHMPLPDLEEGTHSIGNIGEDYVKTITGTVGESDDEDESLDKWIVLMEAENSDN